MSAKTKRVVAYFLAVVVLLAIVAVIGGIKGKQIGMLIAMGKEMEKAGAPPEVVGTAVAERQRWQGRLAAVGNVVSEKGVVLTNEVAGVVKRLSFDSGASVREGQLLVELDVDVERAELASITARRELAEISVQRSRKLVQSGAVPKSQSDTDDSSLKGLLADEQALTAQINRKLIRAPFSGRLGVRLINLGQYLAPGTAIAELESTKALFVDFTLPQQFLTEVRLDMLVRVRPAGAAPQWVEGRVRAIDPTVDVNTRSFKARASLPSKQEQLRAGMFLDVEVLLPEQPDAVVVPQTAVVHAPYGDSVFCVEAPAAGQSDQPAKVARQQFVRVGEVRGDFVAILAGIKEGQEVVSAGAFKLRNGSPILIKNDVQPKAQLDPAVQNR